MEVEYALQAADPDRLLALDAAVVDHGGEGEFSAGDFHPADVRVVTSGGRSIPVHSIILVSAPSHPFSPVPLPPLSSEATLRLCFSLVLPGL